ncbi:MAG: sulfotransferase [Anaerolineales bacterium]|nr:sulfotransferase [Anaerolineales bacterium]
MNRFKKFLDPWEYARFVEPFFIDKARDPEKPQLFILGLPRSGTTLVYQYVVHRLDVAYFSNGVGRYPFSPFLITWWQTRRYGTYQSDFQSVYGKVLGPVAPREAGGFWARFFDLDAYSSYPDVDRVAQVQLKKTIAALQSVFGGAPFVNKNVKHMLRLDALAKIFPAAVFLVVEREMTDVALSVLRGRIRYQPDPQGWWSVKPPNYHRLRGLSVVEQVAGQVLALAERMEVDLENIEPRRVMRLTYQDFCSAPDGFITDLRALLDYPKYRNPACSAFSVVSNQPENDQEKQLIELLQ